MLGFLAKLKNIVRAGKITGPADNSKQFPVQQISFKGKLADTLMVFPYGVYANVSTDDALALMFAIDGNEENRAAIAYTPQKRPTDLANGEVAFYHPFSNSFIKFRNDGTIAIDAKGVLNLDATGDININVSGDANITASSVNIDASVTNLGVGGQPIARVGDAVQVTITGGSSAGTASGTITSGGANTSI